MVADMWTAILISSIFAVFSVAAEDIGFDTEFPEENVSSGGQRVKVDLAVPVCIKSSDSRSVMQSESMSVAVQGSEPAEEAQRASLDVVDMFAAAIEKATPYDVPELFSVALANAGVENIGDIIAVAIEKVHEHHVPSFAAALYATIVHATVPNMSSVELIKIKEEWYEKFSAVEGSKLYWILRVAKERAERGDDVSSLKKAFDETMAKWLNE
jgi:hypothetical protein